MFTQYSVDMMKDTPIIFHTQEPKNFVRQNFQKSIQGCISCKEKCLLKRKEMEGNK